MINAIVVLGLSALVGVGTVQADDPDPYLGRSFSGITCNGGTISSESINGIRHYHWSIDSSLLPNSPASLGVSMSIGYGSWDSEGVGFDSFSDSKNLVYVLTQVDDATQYTASVGYVWSGYSSSVLTESFIARFVANDIPCFRVSHSGTAFYVYSYWNGFGADKENNASTYNFRVYQSSWSVPSNVGFYYLAGDNVGYSYVRRVYTTSSTQNRFGLSDSYFLPVKAKYDRLAYPIIDGYNLGYNDGYAQGYRDAEYYASSEVYAEGYADGYNQGKNDGYANGQASANNALWSAGYAKGKSDGYQEGYSAGDTAGYYRGIAETGETGSMVAIFGSVANVPITIINSLTALTIFDIPIVGIIATILFLALILWVVRKFI